MVDLLVRSSRVVGTCSSWDPEMVGDADSICSLRAGISLALLWGLHPCWQCGGIVDASSIDQLSWWLAC